jgi:histidine triad (HIT) family protein
MASCPFCDIVNARLPARKVYEDEQTLSFLDMYPISRGHCLVIPKKHVQWFTDIEPTDGIAGPFLRTCYTVARKIKHAFDCQYVTMLIRGTRVPHLHMLLIPTVKGEENLMDRTLAMHHFAQVRMRPPFADAELDDIAQRVRTAKT